MSEVPFPIQMLQALATPAIAFLAVAIGGMQWWTARQKLVLDLFDKRFQVFLDVRKIASVAMQLGRLEQPGEVNEIIARGRFLFGDDMQQSLVKLHSLATELEMKQPRASFDQSALRYDASAIRQVSENGATPAPVFYRPYRALGLASRSHRTTRCVAAGSASAAHWRGPLR
jgi:hypothetical protein